MFCDSMSVDILLKPQRNLTMICANSNPIDPATRRNDVAMLLRAGVASHEPQSSMELQAPCLCYEAELPSSLLRHIRSSELMAARLQLWLL